MPKKKNVKGGVPTALKDVIDLVKDLSLRKKLVCLVERPVIRVGKRVYEGLP